MKRSALEVNDRGGMRKTATAGRDEEANRLYGKSKNNQVLDRSTLLPPYPVSLPKS